MEAIKHNLMAFCVSDIVKYLVEGIYLAKGHYESHFFCFFSSIICC